MIQDGTLIPDATVRNQSNFPNNFSPKETLDLLTICAQMDVGGGVSLNHDIFAIYSTALLPASWVSIANNSSRTAQNDEISRLQVLANKVSEFLPIYTSWNEIASSPTLPTIQSLAKRSSSPVAKSIPHPSLISQSMPFFLINATFYSRHCIIGNSSRTEALLLILLRPWCVLEICVSSVGSIETLQAVLDFAQEARRKVHVRYSMAIFLLEHEIQARKDQLRVQHGRRDTFAPCMTYTIEKATGLAYEICNTMLFLPSLKSFNGFWIELICTCAIEIGRGFHWSIRLLCGSERNPMVHITGAMGTVSRFRRYRGKYPGHRRRNSVDGQLFSSQRLPDGNLKESSTVQEMLNLYKDIMERARDSI